ncbi:head-tail adaptor protein [Vibrio parahaemolyticus]|nr:head-tail adaptor protein [Vibrio parahaemolyticus]
MRIGLLRNQIEIWDTKKTLNQYGVYEEQKELLLVCPAAIKELSTELTSGTTQTLISTLQITIRFNRYFKTPNHNMYVVLDGCEYDIVTPPNNSWRLNKYITFTAVLRTK